MLSSIRNNYQYIRKISAGKRVADAKDDTSDPWIKDHSNLDETTEAARKTSRTARKTQNDFER